MQLTLEVPPAVITDPSHSEIDRLLRNEMDFAILADLPDSLTYIQFAWGKGDDGFVLEHQDGSLAEHYSAKNPDIRIEAVIHAFQKFAGRDHSWKLDFVWEHISV